MRIELVGFSAELAALCILSRPSAEPRWVRPVPASIEMRRIGMVDRREQPALAEGFEQIDGLSRRKPLHGHLQAQAIVDRPPRQLVCRS